MTQTNQESPNQEPVLSEPVKPATPLIDVASLFKRSWTLFAAKPIEHIVSSLIVSALSVVSLGVLAGPLFVGQIRLVDKQERGDPVKIEDVFGGFDAFAPACLTGLIVTITVALGLICLALPGIFVAAAWGFSLWFVALRGASASDALPASWQLLKSQTGSVVIVSLLLLVTNLLAAKSLLGVLLSVPLSTIFGTLAFKELTGTRGAAAA
jgi:uncharacterized membrane protein